LQSSFFNTYVFYYSKAFEDTTVLILCAAAVVSLAVGVYDDHRKGIDGDGGKLRLDLYLSNRMAST
jgi:hypothetical protein